MPAGSARSSAQVRYTADLLMSQLHLAKPGDSAVSVTDWEARRSLHLNNFKTSSACLSVTSAASTGPAPPPALPLES